MLVPHSVARADYSTVASPIPKLSSYVVPTAKFHANNHWNDKIELCLMQLKRQAKFG